MAIKFKDATRHGKLLFLPGHAYGFEDPAHAAYFKAAFGAEEAGQQDAEYTFSAEEIEIDPVTIQTESRLLVSDIIEHGSVEKALEAGVKPFDQAALNVQDIAVTAPVDGEK